MTDRLVINGALDAARVNAMRSELDDHAQREDDLVIDMAGCEFLDSSGVGAIVFIYKRKRARGYQVAIEGLTGQPLKLLRHLGIAGLLGSNASRSAA